MFNKNDMDNLVSSTLSLAEDSKNIVFSNNLISEMKEILQQYLADTQPYYIIQGKGKGCDLVPSDRWCNLDVRSRWGTMFDDYAKDGCFIISYHGNQQASMGYDSSDKIQQSIGGSFSQIFKTISVDNGVEFSQPDKIEFGSDGKRTNLYYCHAYCSGERGSNENINRMIRWFFPKGEKLHENHQYWKTGFCITKGKTVFLY